MMMQPTPSSWQLKPDQLLGRVMERARILLAAERNQASQAVDASRQASMANIIATQSQTIDDLTVACSALHAQAKSDSATAERNRSAYSEASSDFAAKSAECLELSAECQRLSAERDRLLAECGDLTSKYADAAAALQAAKTETDGYRASLRSLELRIGDIHRSTSWRVTRPLRSLRLRFSRA